MINNKYFTSKTIFSQRIRLPHNKQSSLYYFHKYYIHTIFIPPINALPRYIHHFSSSHECGEEMLPTPAPSSDSLSWGGLHTAEANQEQGVKAETPG